MAEKKKQLKKAYRQNPPPMGVFLLRSMVNDKVFVGVGQDLNGIINRHRFQLTNNIHPNTRLQSEWNEFGSNNFAFEILEQLNPQDAPHLDYREELAALEQLWLEKLKPFGERGYNEPPLSREEKLRRIAAKRSSEAS